MKAAGLNVPLMGGDGIFSGEYIKLAGATADGDLATSVGAPTDTLPSATAFVEAYKAAGYQEPYEAYGAYAFDAANAIINALKVSLASADSAEAARQATIDAMAKVSFDGVTGKVAFDEFGDTTSKVLTVYEVKGGKWAAINTAAFERLTSSAGSTRRRRRGWSSRTTPAVSVWRRPRSAPPEPCTAGAAWCGTRHARTRYAPPSP